MQIEMRKSQHQFENETRTSSINQATQLRNLKVQKGQMAIMISEWQQGHLLSTSEVKPRRDGKEHCKAITLRSGKMVETNIHVHKGNVVEENDKNDETPAQNEKNNVEIMGNTERLSKSSVVNTPMKVQESCIEKKPNVA